MRFYELLSEYYDDLFPVTPNEMSFLCDALPDLTKGGTVVDIGCGTGGHSIALAKMGYQVVGLDLEPEMIERARMRAPQELLASEELAFKVADMLQLPISDGRANACICIGNTLAHLPSLDHVQKAMAEMARLLARGGVAIVQVVNYDRVLIMGHVDLPDIELPLKGLTFRRRYESIDGGHVVFRSTLCEGMPASENISEVMMTPLLSQFMKDAAQHAGFAVMRVCGDFAGSAYLGTSPSLVMVLQKEMRQ